MQESLPATPPPSRSALPWLVLAGVALVGFLVVWAIDRWEPTEPIGESHPAVGKSFSRLKLQPLTAGSRRVGASALRGHVTVINFWGTWCPPCRQEFPHIVALAGKFKTHRAFQLFAISCGNGDDRNLESLKQKTEQFLSANNFKIPTFADHGAISREVAFALVGHATYPTTIVLDGSLVVRGLWTGYAPGDELAVERLVQELLASSTVSDG